jgi:hypothetical protein
MNRISSASATSLRCLGEKFCLFILHSGGSEGSSCVLDGEEDDEALEELEDEEEELAGASLFQVRL